MTYTAGHPVCVRCAKEILGPQYHSDISGNGPWCVPCFHALQDEWYGRQAACAALAAKKGET